jgi:hypothetical protein
MNGVTTSLGVVQARLITVPLVLCQGSDNAVHSDPLVLSVISKASSTRLTADAL